MILPTGSSTRIKSQLTYTLNILLLTIALFALAQACHSPNAESGQEQGSLAALDEKNGFQDAEFGMPLAAFHGLVPDEYNKPDDYFKNYTVSSGKKMLGEIPLSLIEYTFYKGRLIAIEFRAEGKENSSYVLQALRAAYGPGQESSIGSMWEGENVRMYSMAYQETNTYSIRIDINSQKMYRENIERLKRDRKEKAERNASDL